MSDVASPDLDPAVYGGFVNQQYWRKRSDLLYYRYVDYIVRALGPEAKSLIDVGSGNCPYMEWFDWIPERVSVDLGVPYASDTVKGIRGDIHELEFEHEFDICTCLQVLEHVPEAGPFARRLLELASVVVVSVPFNWPANMKVPGHVHDPVDYKKLTGWMGREANYRIAVKEPFTDIRRLIAVYDRDPKRKFGRAERQGRHIR